MNQRMLTGVAVFSILMGLALTGTWVVMFLLGQVPELATTPWQTSLLLVAEFLTGFTLVVSGAGTLAHKKWSTTLSLVALGMLIYCTINYSGVLAQQNNPVAIFMAIVAGTSIVFSSLFVYAASRGRSSA